MTIAAIYSLPKHKITTQHYSNFFNSIHNNCIVGGDFNAKHHSWGCQTNNPHGQILYNFVTGGNLKVLAPPGPTYWSSSARKSPDILDIFITKLPYNIYCITENILGLNSGHSSIPLILNVSPPLRQESLKLFNYTTNKS